MRYDLNTRFCFPGRILIQGCGSVAQCLLPLILRHFDMPPDRILVIDKDDKRPEIADALAAGVRFEQIEITPDNYVQFLNRSLSAGDLYIDVAWNIETLSLLEWAHQTGVLYINTSVEEWDPYSKVGAAQTLYARQMKIRQLVASWNNRHQGPTAVLDHGANPGLVSHFVKVALLQIAQKILDEKPEDARVASLREAIDSGAFNQLAMLTGTKVIHISERDTQVTSLPKRPNEFVNTWSIEGFYEEGIAPAELGWGTHEKRLPVDACHHQRGPQNQIYLDNHRGMDTLVRSWVPGGQIHGMVIRHGEAFSISEYLTVKDSKRRLQYRPTVHYAYWPTDSAVASLYELRARNLVLQDNLRIMTNEVTDGADILGCLLMGHDYGAWWIGSTLDIHETRRLLHGQNPTTLQVASSMLGALNWMLRNPNRGINLPDQLPHEEILAVARPYLGPIFSQAIDWRPNPQIPLEDEQWQFDSFLINHDPAQFWLPDGTVDSAQQSLIADWAAAGKI
jgi:homospermidine synthase